MEDFDQLFAHLSEEPSEEQAREEFLEFVNRTARYWAGKGNSNVPESYTLEERLDGFAHSLLSGLDGCVMGLRPYTIIPKFSSRDGMAWIQSNVDIAGGLHEQMKRIA